ncbi:hypothetical protein F511_11870 [Dorcoceras hygrometricum]|uniref:Uncharacterized protein n=1 Tax=Dorcoceras hygrometricum TaxID=472368 RepID=A0A2Z7C7S9_9LAMI|nr:hypothetical protein F511_11870 [Dorcoceras hygrometricum]
MDQQMREFRVTSCWFGVEEVERRRFVNLTNKEFSSWTFSKANPTADDLAKQFQQQRSSSDNSAAMQNQQQRKFSRGDFIFSTIQVLLREARFFVQKASPWKFEKIPHAYKGKFRAVTVELRESEKQQFCTPKVCEISAEFLAKVLCKRRFSRRWYGDGKAINRLIRAHDKVTLSRRSMDKVIHYHERLMGQLEELCTKKDEEMKSLEFETLCSEKAVVYFDNGFNGCLVQFLANGYSKEEHPATFIDVVQELEDMPEDDHIWLEQILDEPALSWYAWLSSGPYKSLKQILRVGDFPRERFRLSVGQHWVLAFSFGDGI